VLTAHQDRSAKTDLPRRVRVSTGRLGSGMRIVVRLGLLFYLVFTWYSRTRKNPDPAYELVPVFKPSSADLVLADWNRRRWQPYGQKQN